jgi:type III pantothenate kinase
MHLVIDSGNSLVKTAVFENNQIVFQSAQPDMDPYIITEILNRFPIRAAIISDVKGSLQVQLPPKVNTLRMSGTTPTPLVMQYESTYSLGSDRLAASVYAWHLFPSQTTLIIQAGTCITFDLVTHACEYKGGAISPGLDLRFQSLNTFTGKLPLVKKKEINFLVGATTEESILSGIMNGSVAEIDATIDRYLLLYPGLNVVLGGGDTFYFDKKLKNRIFAIENLVLRGLNLILEYNVNLEK